MTAPQLWPIFICYRRVDGHAAARRLYEMLDKFQTTAAESQPIQIDAYLDDNMPGIPDWRAMHTPYLEKARAIVVVCTPGAKLNEGPDDWVHYEIDWWIEHRETAPILIDPLGEGPRFVPLQIARRWPDIQRISLIEEEWRPLSGAALEHKTAVIRRQIVGAILPSGAAIYAQELAEERERAQELKRALSAAEASLLDARAASLFGESRLTDARRDLEMSRRTDIVERLAAAKDSGAREGNLRHELKQLDSDVAALKAASKAALTTGREYLQRADLAWAAVATGQTAQVERIRPEPPYIFSVELINAGSGESVLVHFGTPDDTRVIMINAGPRISFRSNLEPRLRQLSMARFDAGPVPIELFIVGDRDEDKTGGLERLLSNMVETDSTGERIAEVRGIWANIFRIAGEQTTLRSHIRKLIDGLRIPLNEPFDHHVMRRASGRTVVNMPGGLEITVLAPGEHRLAALHEMSAQEARKIGGEIETLLAETFSRITVETDPAPLRIANRVVDAQSACTPSENAQRLAGGSYTDMQIGNLASTVALFRFRDRTFLFTGDSRGDEILAGLSSAAMLDDRGEATVDLMTIPHLGSDRNVTVDFFRRVKASGYLFSGDGRHGNPATTTVAALVTARGCDAYRMYFVNRDGATPRPDPALDGSTAAAPSRKVNRRQEDDPLGTRLDAFFKDEQRFNPNYRRVFRSSSSGSVIIDLLHPMRY